MKIVYTFLAATILCSCTTTSTQLTLQEQACPSGEALASLAICTMDYAPVCGRLSSNQWQTYSNACDACASGAVSHLEGDCAYIDEENILNG